MNWTAEEAPADDAQEVWAPAVGHPALQYSSIVDIFGSSCSLQPYVVPASTSSSSSGGPQLLVENNYYAAAAQHHDPTGKGTTMTHEDLSSFEQQMESYMNSPKKLFQERKKEFEDAYNAQFMKQKMHRYPPSIRALDDDGLYTVPRVVAIGPYHHYGGGHLKQAEEVKHAAACHCITESGRSVEEMYGAVISAANDSDARGLYHTDVMAGLGDDDCFLPMMFFDACFLVMYILKRSGAENYDPTLYDFFESNDDDIAHDIMLLENQIPLQVVDAVMNMCTAEPLERMKMFIARCKDGCLQDRVEPGLPRVDWDEDYYNKAPHLLGLLRFYVVGKRRRSRKPKVSPSDLKKMESITISAGAIELAEMGIFLTANETTELPDMGLSRKWIIFAELSMAPLSLNDARASWLVNMAALELCTTPDFFDAEAEFEDSAVCSYLLLLCMLMHREEDVHELRTKGILQGGAGLNNKKTLDFFTSLQSLRKGRCYALVMVEIQNYRNKRPWIKVYAFLYNNWKYIVAVGSAFSGFIGIITALMKLKGAH
ncbi:unnamed protein product [Miscanthus lutarioriparius]|uniref:Uncharacterized protein n=1 Tax=Miscanthus lutarioriparius TaxID=422564 RepID=A0A811Q878_9POAL|nr:unnamed protein product [Miscanthus lutarioriparius]